MAMRTRQTGIRNGLLAVVMALPMFAVVEYIYRIELDRSDAALRSDVLQQTATMRARLEAELNANWFLATGMVGYVTAYDDFLEPDRVRTALQVIHSQSQFLRNVALAPENELRYVFPIEGNEAAIGLRYEDNADQWPAVERAIREGQTVLTGPLALIQGGRGLISRTPVYIDQNRYWGLLSLVIDSEALFEALGFDDSDSIRFGLEWRSPPDVAGQLISGDSSVFDRAPVEQEIRVPGGYWRLAAAPEDGWGSDRRRLGWYRLGGMLLSLMVLTLIYLVLDERKRVARMAMRDQLTGLPNRHAFKLLLDQRLHKASRRQQPFALLYVDLDGFKAVNDRYGHGRGDSVLSTLAERMAAALSPEDEIARIGGDEFIVLLPKVGDRDEARRRSQPIVEAVRRPVPGLAESERLDASIGVAIFPNDGDAAEILLQKADIDMYAGKRRSRVGAPAES